MKYDETLLQLIANTIRGLSMDAIEAANSGHPGLPLGCAEIVSYLYAHEMKHNPDDPDWVNRDRFILSAGHGSMVLYSALHLAGYNVSLDDIKNFRQLHVKTAGHPEYGEIDGIETTTGPLGQGLATSVGMALGQKIVAQKLNQEHDLIDSHVYVLAGDGCFMEGVTAEASSLAGHLNLDNLIVIYDSNDICLDGPTDECFTEDTKLRYESYGWMVQSIDGHSFKMIEAAINKAKKAKKPSLIIANTVIGKGSPNLQGTSEVHGKAMGTDEVAKTKEFFDIPLEPTFYVPREVQYFFESRNIKLKKSYLEWKELFHRWRINFPEHSDEYEKLTHPIDGIELKEQLLTLDVAQNKATRSQSAQVLQILAQSIPSLIGGSADLSCSDNTYLKNFSMITAGDYSGRNIKYGVREFAMAAIASGLVLTKLFKAYVGTFLMFSDYMRNAVRLSALMNIPVIYQFTHDSVFLGEDGPTHQPVEHLASLRAMPNLTVVRPADEIEVKAAWYLALTRQSPTAIVLSRQNIESTEQTNFNEALRGAYVVLESESADLTIYATGSELALALKVANQLKENDINARVVSLLSWEVFNEQSDEYKASVTGKASYNVSIEAQSSFGWERFIGKDGLAISVDQFGVSGKYNDIVANFGFQPETIVEKIKKTFKLEKATQ